MIYEIRRNVKMLNLKSVLLNKKIQDNLKGDLMLSEDELKNALATIIVTLRENTISVVVVKKDKEYDFENTLHYDSDKQIYLLESRLFGCDGMDSAYLGILDSDGNIADIPYVDDVWSYADWKVVC
jgi:hypothetical protein